MNDNVIVSMGAHSDNNTYHTTDCVSVWQLNGKRYIPEEEAKRRGYEKCTYCAGEFNPRHEEESGLCYKLQKADPEDLLTDD